MFCNISPAVAAEINSHRFCWCSLSQCFEPVVVYHRHQPIDISPTTFRNCYIKLLELNHLVLLCLCEHLVYHVLNQKRLIFTVLSLLELHSYTVLPRARILVQVTIHRRLLIGREGRLDQSEAYDIS